MRYRRGSEMVVSLEFMVERSVKLANAQCPPLPRDSADRGGAAGGGVRIGSTLQSHKLFYLLPRRQPLRG